MSARTGALNKQGCPQDVKSQERDETETVNLQDRDVPFFQTLQDRDETETLNPQDRDVPKKRLETETFQKRIKTAVSQFKTPTDEVSHLTTCFLQVRSIIFFVIYSHCMHVHKTKVTRPRRYIFKTETRPRRSTFETETFKTETTSLSTNPALSTVAAHSM